MEKLVKFEKAFFRADAWSWDEIVCPATVIGIAVAALIIIPSFF